MPEATPTPQAQADPIRRAIVFLRNKASSDCRGDAYSNQDAAFLAGVEAALHEYDVAMAASSPAGVQAEPVAPKPAAAVPALVEAARDVLARQEPVYDEQQWLFV